MIKRLLVIWGIIMVIQLNWSHQRQGEGSKSSAAGLGNEGGNATDDQIMGWWADPIWFPAGSFVRGKGGGKVCDIY